VKRLQFTVPALQPVTRLGSKVYMVAPIGITLAVVISNERESILIQYTRSDTF
jgi:hypothetical protein